MKTLKKVFLPHGHPKVEIFNFRPTATRRVWEQK